MVNVKGPDASTYFSQPANYDRFESFVHFYARYCHPPGDMPSPVDDYPGVFCNGLAWQSGEVVVLRHSETEPGKKVDYLLTSYDITTGERTEFPVAYGQPSLLESNGFSYPASPVQLRFSAEQPYDVTLTLSTQGNTWQNSLIGKQAMQLGDIQLLPYEVAHRLHLPLDYIRTVGGRALGGILGLAEAA